MSVPANLTVGLGREQSFIDVSTIPIRCFSILLIHVRFPENVRTQRVPFYCLAPPICSRDCDSVE